jgi:bacterioferritin (cytochrome b1)
MAVPNVEYDVMTVLQSKLEAVAVYDKYIQDCEQAGNRECRDLLEEIKKDDTRHADRLRTQLKRLIA